MSGQSCRSTYELGNQSKLCADELVRTSQGPPITQASRVRPAKDVRNSGRGVLAHGRPGAIILLVFGAVVLLRFLPQPKSRVTNESEREALEDLQVRLGQLDQLQVRIGELEERVDFAERILVKQREGERLGLPQDWPQR